MELIQLGKNTYYIKNPTNIGIYKIDEKNVYLIDSGNDKDAGKKILKIIDGQGWSVAGIISTHSNADHIGGNRLIQDRTGCKVLAHGIEKCITQYPILEPSFLYGSVPFKALKNKFIYAKESEVTEIDGNLPQGLEYFSLKGHFFDMIGIKTDDDVYFLADSLFSELTIEKYHLFFIYDVAAYLETLNNLSGLNGRMFVPSHCEATDDISALVDINRKKIEQLLDNIYNICGNGSSYEEILKKVFDLYGLTMNLNQYYLVGSTVKAYLTYLVEEGKIGYEFIENQMLWKKF